MVGDESEVDFPTVKRIKNSDMSDTSSESSTSADDDRTQKIAAAVKTILEVLRSTTVPPYCYQ